MGLGEAYKEAVGASVTGKPSHAADGPPPPTNIGKMDTGSGNPRDHASAAIMALRTLVTSYPQMKERIDGMVAEIKSATQKSGALGAGPGAIPPPIMPLPGATPPPGGPLLGAPAPPMAGPGLLPPPLPPM